MKKNKNNIKKALMLVNKIQNIRSKNNKNWMDLVRLAYKYAPKEASNILSQIYKEDSAISNLTSQLTNYDE